MGDADHKGEELKGRGKEALGALADDPDLKREGKIDQASAATKRKIGEVADDVKDAVGGRDD